MFWSGVRPMSGSVRGIKRTFSDGTRALLVTPAPVPPQIEGDWTSGRVTVHSPSGSSGSTTSPFSSIGSSGVTDETS